MNPDFPRPFVFVPKQGDPRLLFVLLHGESAGPEQLFPLAEAIKQAFPLALVVLPHAFVHVAGGGAGAAGGPRGYHWIDPAGLEAHNYASRVAQALPGLIKQIQQIQARYGLSGEQTALGGFSQGACMALEAGLAQPDLAGRILAFSGLYASQPAKAPPLTMLHFFHGAEDRQLPAGEVQAALAHLGELQGDVTLDVASAIGHELHPALIRQAIVRLQTCVPLRNWEAALSALQEQAAVAAAADTGKPAPASGRTLH
ncbi:phospholipase/carboxylesterase [Pollutimonas bauzanensis]|uniref:Phospholipase/carboxylesterase n=2 Tax=Pollutimonas bauzanensis TaxID=658167 RepID=A0A1M6AGP2_9BURK|nr:phospholipase/carboxylesterase [Pollutimonas bauzanensis]